MHIPSFIKAFFIPELRAIVSKTLMIIGTVLVMSLALWSIGFSNGASEFLKDKMDSPFIKFLSIEIPNSKYIEIEDLRGKLEAVLSDSINQKRFNYSSYGFVPTHYPNFIAPSGKEHRAKVRPIEPNSALYKFLFRNKDLLLTNKLVRMDDSPWSIVVSENLLASLNIEMDECPPFLDYFVKYDENREPITIPLPIAAIVKQLPDQNDAFIAPRAYYSAAQQYEFTPFDPTNVEYERNLKLFIETDLALSKIEDIIGKCGLEHDISIQKNVENFKNGFYLKSRFLSRIKKEEFLASLRNCLTSEKDIGVHEIFDYDLVSKGQLRKVREDNIIVNFNDLDSVHVFAKHIYNKFKINANMNDIESGKNFNIFNKITKVLSAVLTLFAIAIIVYIISRSILEHIDRNSANLGTLKAYGLSNTNITLVFTSIALIIILVVFILGYIIALIVGELMGSFIFSYFFDLQEISGGIFSLNLTLLLFTWFIILPYVIIAYVVNNKIKDKTPGDLIYGR